LDSPAVERFDLRIELRFCAYYLKNLCYIIHQAQSRAGEVNYFQTTSVYLKCGGFTKDNFVLSMSMCACLDIGASEAAQMHFTREWAWLFHFDDESP
jgi:hypothetical protein